MRRARVKNLMSLETMLSEVFLHAFRRLSRPIHTRPDVPLNRPDSTSVAVYRRNCHPGCTRAYMTLSSSRVKYSLTPVVYPSCLPPDFRPTNSQLAMFWSLKMDHATILVPFGSYFSRVISHSTTAYFIDSILAIYRPGMRFFLSTTLFHAIWHPHAILVLIIIQNSFCLP